MSNIDIISSGIKEIYETRGNEAFTNARMFHALLDDMVSTLTIERKILRSAIDDSLLKELFLMFDNSVSDKQFEAIRLKKKIEDSHGLSEKWSLFIIESFASAASIHININVDNNSDKVKGLEVNCSSAIEEPQVYVLADGSKYSGELVNGAPHGIGKNIYPNGATYIGEWCDGRKHGNGTFVYPSGDIFSGTFVGGMPAKGKYKWTNGNIYEGEYLNGKRNGRGKYTWVNGDTYEGEFVNGKITGNGIMIRNGIIQKGYFENGVLKVSQNSNPKPSNNIESGAKKVTVKKSK